MNQTHPTPDELVDYLHGELSPARDAAVHGHLAGCAQCCDARDGELSLTEMLRAQARAQERELPPGVVASIRAAIESRPISIWERLRAAFRPAIALPAAAAIALACYLGVSALHTTARANTIDAAYYVDNHATLSSVAPLSDDDPIPRALTEETDEAR